MQQNLTPINQLKIKKFLHFSPEDAIKWNAFIEGEWNLTPDMIDKMTAPQLSILIWAMKKRYKFNSNLYGSQLGTTGKTIGG